MPIERKSVDLSVEKFMLSAMIMSDDFLRDMGELYDPKLIESPYVRTVAGWCMEYWQNYTRAPGQDIETIYATWVRSGDIEESQQTLIGNFLEGLAEEYDNADKINVAFILDKVKERFKKRALTNLAEDVKSSLSIGKVEEAEMLVANFRRVDLAKASYVNPYTDADVIRDAFEKQIKPLFEFDGAVGTMLNDHLVREGFLAFLGKEKSGKTFSLIEMMEASAKARNNTAFFSCGDMSLTQMTTRVHIKLSRRSTKHKYCGEIYVPFCDCKLNQEDKCRRPDGPRTHSAVKMPEVEENHKLGPKEIMDANPDYTPCVRCRHKQDSEFVGATWWLKRPAVPTLTWREGLLKGRKFFSTLRGQGSGLRMCAHPNSTVSPGMIKDQCLKWQAKDGYLPDVIILDYADIMIPDEKKYDPRDKHNLIWMGLRRLSQELHCLVITATQANRAGFHVNVLTDDHVSEDKRKLAHATGIIGLNRTDDEKRCGRQRWNWVVLREDEFITEDTITVLQCLPCGQAIMDSY